MRIVNLLTTSIVSMLLATSMAAAAAESTTYPTKPIRIIIGSAAGSGPDIFSRALSERLYQSWNQRVVVDARPGAAGVISADLALRAIPDGYTWMMLTSQLLVATAVLPEIKFNLARDFQSISLIGTVPFVQLVNPQIPAKSIPELIALAKTQPLRYGSAGTGASEHLSGVLFTHLTGTQMLHVPYKGIAQAIADTLAREVQLTYAVLPAANPHIQSGRLRPLGVTTQKRAALLPDVPSISEVVPGYETMGWYSIVAPTGTPVAILDQISKEIRTAAVKDPDFRAQLERLGTDIVGSTRSELDAFRRDQTKKIGAIVKISGVSAK